MTITAPLLVVDVSMHKTVPTRPLWTPLYCSAMPMSLVIDIKALSVKPLLAANAAKSSPSRPR